MIEGEPFNTEFLEIQSKTALSKYEYPKEIRFLEKFEETANGKVKNRKFM
jgi:non-ribosomal peptide synthetase component E (peptide arylation enzyme)